MADMNNDLSVLSKTDGLNKTRSKVQEHKKLAEIKTFNVAPKISKDNQTHQKKIHGKKIRTTAASPMALT